MKEKFVIYPNLMAIEETMKAHQAYCVLAVSTTGVENSDEATRVCMQSYLYDDEIKAYQKGLDFDVLVEANPEAVQRAIQRADAGGYDCFATAGIDRVQYQNGTNVQTKDNFVESFSTFMKALPDDTLLIANNARHCENFLGKLQCGTWIQEKEQEGKYLCQNSITAEYFSKAKIPYKNVKLETLRDTLVGGNQEKGEIIGTDSRLAVMNSFLTKYGNDILVLDERETHFRTFEKGKLQAMSETGKQNYEKASYEEKMKLLTQTMGVVNLEGLENREYDCALHRLQDILERKHGEKGIIFMQVATTGLKDNRTNVDPKNDPIQFSAISCEFVDGTLKPIKFLSFDIQAGESNVAVAVSQSQKGKFDAFSFTGIDYEKYKQGLSTESTPEKPKLLKQKAEAEEKIASFLKKYEDFAIVTAGTDKNHPNISFLQGAFESNHYFGDHHVPFSAMQEKFVDFSQFIKEHLGDSEREHHEPAIIDIEKWEGKKFSLEEIAKHRGVTINNTMDRCKLMIACTLDFLLQEKALHPEIYQAIDEKEKELRAISERKQEEKKRPVKLAEKITQQYSEEFPEVPMMPYESSDTEPDVFQRQRQTQFSSKRRQEEILSVAESIPPSLFTQKRESSDPMSRQSKTRSYGDTEPKMQKILGVLEQQTTMITEQNATNQKAIETIGQLAEAVKTMTQTYATFFEKMNVQEKTMINHDSQVTEQSGKPIFQLPTQSDTQKTLKERMNRIIEELQSIHQESQEIPEQAIKTQIQMAMGALQRAERLLNTQKKIIEQE